MDRQTRDKFASGTNQLDLTTGTACWETAPAIFDQLNADFGPFDLDLTADGQRALHAMWFGPDSPVQEYDARTAPWCRYGQCGYSNPPYGSFIQELLAKAKHEAHQGCTSLLLLPLRVTKAFRAHVLNGASDLIFPDKRLVFFEQGVPRVNERAWTERQELRADPALFDSILVRYRPGHHERPAIAEWNVPPHVFPADLERWAARRATAGRVDEDIQGAGAHEVGGVL